MKWPTFNGGPKNERVPFYSHRGEFMGHQLYLGPKRWFLWGGSLHAFWFTAGPLSIAWSRNDRRRKDLRGDASA
jgi:hypothetical protein